MTILHDGLNRSRSHGCNISQGRSEKRQSSRVSQIETPLDTLNADVHPIKAIRHIGILVLEIADALLYLANIIPHIIDRAADMAKVLKNDVVRLGHDVRLSQL